MDKKAVLAVFLAFSLALSFGCTGQQDGSDKGDANTGKGLAQDGEAKGEFEMSKNDTGIVVEEGDAVKVEYKGTLEDGTVFDKSEGREPLEFTAGAGEMIKGFDAAVIGMELNGEKSISLEPPVAYGERREELVVEVDKGIFEGQEDMLSEGAEVTAGTGEKGVILKINEETGKVMIDFNHRLAGKTLDFWIKVVDIQKK